MYTAIYYFVKFISMIYSLYVVVKYNGLKGAIEAKEIKTYVQDFTMYIATINDANYFQEGR